ncbi:MAG: response regulator [Desulfamplus sp.]|nr:response regulator [Desulfamplus sp.]
MTRKPKSFQSRLAWQISTFVGISLLIVTFALSYLFVTAMTRQLETHISITSIEKLRNLNVYLDILSESSKRFSENQLIINSLVDFQRRESYLPQLVTEFSKGIDISAASIVDFAGNIIFATDPAKIEISDKNKIYLRETLAFGKQTIFRNKEENRIVLMQPIIYYDTSQGAVVVTFSLERIMRRLMTESESANYRLYDNDSPAVTVGFAENTKYISKRSYPVKETTFVSKMNFSLEIGIEKKSFLKPVWIAIGKESVLVFALIFISWLITLRLAGKITKPVVALRDSVTASMESGEASCEEVCRSISETNGNLQELAKDNELQDLAKYEELQDLAEVFDKRTKQLLTAKKRLEKSRQELESRVEERTSELAKKNLELENAKNSAEAAKEEAVIAKNEAEKAKEEAEAASRSKSIFLANMSHEIRTPMNAIIGLTDLSLDTPMTEKQRDYLVKIRSSAHSLLGIINDILDYSKIEAGKLTLEKEDFDLLETVEILFDLFGGKADEKGIEFFLSVDPEIPPVLKGDALRLRQVLINLTSNAIKFTDTGNIIVKAELLKDDSETAEKGYNKTDSGDNTAQVDDNTTQTDNNTARFDNNTAQVDDSTVQSGSVVKVLFSITDSGVGIPLDKQQEIFGSFTQADDSTTRNYGGTGLGLAICSRLVSIMGGEIWVESEPEKGSTFFFTASFTIGEQEFVCKNIDPGELEGLGILIVDDNETARLVFSQVVKSLKFEPFTASSGLEALELLDSCDSNSHSAKAGIRFDSGKTDAPFDIAIIDWRMPKMDGIELALKIRDDKRFANMPIIMTTSYDTEEIQKSLVKFNLKVESILPKPVKPSQLFTVIASIFGRECEAIPVTERTLSYGADAYLEKIGGARILLAEDNSINQQVASEILKKAGMVVDVADNGRIALELLDKNSYDAVLMDLQMPVMGGYEATAIIRSDPRFSSLPVIAMTAHAMDEDKKRCIEAGMNDYISKPIDTAQLYSTIAKWVKPKKREALSLSQVLGQSNVVESNAEVKFSSVEDDIPDNLPGIDVKRGLALLSGNRPLYRKLLAEFYNQNRELMAELKNHIESRDYKSAHILTHTLKGVAGSIGATSLQQAASELDDILNRESRLKNEKSIQNIQDLDNQEKNQDTDIEKNQYFDKELEEPLQSVHRLFDEILETSAPFAVIPERKEKNKGGEDDREGENEIVNENKNGKNDIDIKTLLKKIEELLQLVQKNNFNASAAFTAIERECMICCNSKDIDTLKNRLNAFDFKGAESVLEKIKEELC